jgi:glycosyltransferase involved in cell wall biosynthesis
LKNYSKATGEKQSTFSAPLSGKEAFFVRIVMVTPFFHQPRGNTITVQRIKQQLVEKGMEAEVVSLTEDSGPGKLPPCDLVHGFNAYRFYEYWKQLGCPAVPYMVTMTGTDLNHDLFDEHRRGTVIESVTKAKAVHVFNIENRDKLLQEIPQVKDKTYLIPQGVSAMEQNSSFMRKPEGTFLFLLPAGIRRVKNISSAISMLSALHRKDSRIHLWLVGPVIEEAEGERVRALVEQNSSWIRYLGQLPHSQMAAVYRLTDVVLNTSISEGQSSSILEAMAEGLPVIASDNTGNRDLVKHGETGYIYKNEDDFVRYAMELVNDPDLRKRMGLKAKAFVGEHHSPQKEIESLLKIYQQIVVGGDEA